MRTSPIIVTLALAFSLGACALPTEEGDVITLQNATGKEDGRAEVLIPLSSEQPGATARFVCDEWSLDRCEIRLSIYTDVATESSGRRYLENLGFPSHLDLAAIRVIQPDGERAEILLVGGDAEVRRDVVRRFSEWQEPLYGGDWWLRTELEGEYELPGQFVVRSWQKGEFLIELDHLPLPEGVPDARTMYVTAWWQ